MTFGLDILTYVVYRAPRDEHFLVVVLLAFKLDFGFYLPLLLYIIVRPKRWSFI